MARKRSVAFVLHRSLSRWAREGELSWQAQESGTQGGIEWAMEEEMYTGFQFGTARAHEMFGLKVRLMGTQVAGAGL